MKREEINLGDIGRIIIGNAPPEFLIEVFVRTFLIYLAVLVVVRLLGKRMSGQVSIVEMSLLIMLGAIIGSPIQIPDRGIFTALIILITTMVLQRVMNRLAYRYRKVERMTEGSSRMLVKNGVLVLEQMQNSRISSQQLFAALREHDIKQLGEVKRVYLEPGGLFSVFKTPHPVSGLPIFPGDDTKILSLYTNKDHHTWACERCGQTTDQSQTCTVCGNKQFSPAID